MKKIIFTTILCIVLLPQICLASSLKCSVSDIIDNEIILKNKCLSYGTEKTATGTKEICINSEIEQYVKYEYPIFTEYPTELQNGLYEDQSLRKYDPVNNQSLQFYQKNSEDMVVKVTSGRKFFYQYGKWRIVNSDIMLRSDYEDEINSVLSILKQEIIGYNALAVTASTTPDKDNRLADNDFADNNYGAINLDLGYDDTDASSHYRHTIVTVTTPALSGTITSADLYFLVADERNASTLFVSLHEMTETHEDDYVEGEATWNSYETGNTWDTPGCSYDATDIDRITGFSNETWTHFCIQGGDCDNPLSLNFSTEYYLLTTFDPQPNTTLSQYVNTYSKEDAVNQRPYLEITYTPTADSGETGTTTVKISDFIPVNNELSMVVEMEEVYNASGTLTQRNFGYYHIPFFIYLIFAIPVFWIAQRFIIEFLIRLRKK